MRECLNLYHEFESLENSMLSKEAASSQITGHIKSIGSCQPERFTIVNEPVYEHASHLDDGTDRLMQAEGQAALLEILYEYLKQMVAQNDVVSGSKSSPFRGDVVRFTAAYYAKRIARYSGASPCCLISTIIYLQRVNQRYPDLCLTSRTMQRLLLVAAMEATKYLEDVSCPNSHWARIGGLSLEELNTLELDFLFGIDFDLTIQPREYKCIVDNLLSFHAQRSVVDDRQDGAAAGLHPAKAAAEQEEPVHCPSISMPTLGCPRETADAALDGAGAACCVSAAEAPQSSPAPPGPGPTTPALAPHF